jgi:hypothetical protein
MVDDRIKNRVVQLHQEGMSIADIAQKLNIKKHLVEGVLKGVRENAETPIETPITRFQTPQTETLPTAREKELALELEVLREKNRNKELEKQIAELQYKQIEAKELTERERIRGENGLEEKRIATEKLKVEAELKKQRKQELETELANKEHKKVVKDLENRINTFLQEFAEHEPDEDYECDADKASEYEKNAKKLRKEITKLFRENSQDLLHYQALDCIVNTFDDNTKYYFTEVEIELINLCLATDTELGDIGEEIYED